VTGPACQPGARGRTGRQRDGIARLVLEAAYGPTREATRAIDGSGPGARKRDGEPRAHPDEPVNAAAEMGDVEPSPSVLAERADAQAGAQQCGAAPRAVARLDADPDRPFAEIAEHVGAVERRNVGAAVAIAARDRAAVGMGIVQDREDEAAGLAPRRGVVT